jgi:hypothetical protein
VARAGGKPEAPARVALGKAPAGVDEAERAVAGGSRKGPCGGERIVVLDHALLGGVGAGRLHERDAHAPARPSVLTGADIPRAVPDARAGVRMRFEKLGGVHGEVRVHDRRELRIGHALERAAREDDDGGDLGKLQTAAQDGAADEARCADEDDLHDEQCRESG